jgi:hypothetical protein
MTRGGAGRWLGDLAWIAALVVVGIAAVIAVGFGLLFYPPALLVVLVIGLILLVVRPPRGVKVSRNTRVVLLVAIGALLVGTALWVRAGPTPEQVAGEDAVVRMISVVGASSEGERMDLAQVLDVPWDRAVLMDAYMTGDDMNAVLGFDGYPSDASSQADEATQFIVFVRGETVVADTNLWPDEGFQFDDAIRAFTRTDAVFVAHRGQTIVELTRP